MSPLAWKILSIIMNAVKRDKDEPEQWTGYIAGWSLNQLLGYEANINGVDVKYPHNDCQRAMKELIDAGLIREKPDLPERFELVVKESKQEQPEPAKEPTIAEYWSQLPRVQGKLRKEVEPPTEPSRCIVKVEGKEA